MRVSGSHEGEASGVLVPLMAGLCRDRERITCRGALQCTVRRRSILADLERIDPAATVLNGQLK
jgi:hypothetical protein